MRGKIVLMTALATLLLIGIGHAQEPRDFSRLATQIVRLPGTTYSIVFNSPELQVGEPRNMPALSEAIAAWLSANFGLPTMRHAPRIAYAPAADIAPFRARSSSETASIAEIPSFYAGHSQTIFLPEGWNGITPVELSVFVREMVHHVQGQGNNAYHCTPSDNEKFAHAVQRRWLALFGDDGQKATPTDSHGLVVSPRCVLWQSKAGG